MTQRMHMAAIAGQQGWAKFDNFDEMQQRQRAAASLAQAEQVELIAKAFSTEAGRACLDMLVQKIMLAPFVLPLHGGFTAEQQAMWAAFRQGQNDVVSLMVNALSAQRNGQPEAVRMEG